MSYVNVLTSALDAGEWSASSPDRFNPKERRYPLNRRMYGSYGMDVSENTKVSYLNPYSKQNIFSSAPKESHKLHHVYKLYCV